MPTARSGLGVAIVNDELYIIGGRTSEEDNFSAVMKSILEPVISRLSVMDHSATILN